MAAAGSLAMKRRLRLQLASVTSESMTSNPLLVEDEEGKRIKTVTSSSSSRCSWHQGPDDGFIWMNQVSITYFTLASALGFLLKL